MVPGAGGGVAPGDAGAVNPGDAGATMPGDGGAVGLPPTPGVVVGTCCGTSTGGVLGCCTVMPPVCPGCTTRTPVGMPYAPNGPTGTRMTLFGTWFTGYG